MAHSANALAGILAGMTTRDASNALSQFLPGNALSTPNPLAAGLLGIGALARYPAPSAASVLDALNTFAERPRPRRRVFISFKSEDLGVVQLVRDIAASDQFDLDIYDESLKSPFDSNNAEYIRRGIRDHISRTSVTICVVGPNTHTSKWVDWELFESAAKGNKIICMTGPGGPQRVVAPRLLRQMGAPVFQWDVGFLRQEIQNAPTPVPYW